MSMAFSVFSEEDELMASHLHSIFKMIKTVRNHSGLFLIEHLMLTFLVISGYRHLCQQVKLEISKSSVLKGSFPKRKLLLLNFW